MILLLLAAALGADVYESTFDEANGLYRAGEFSRAAAAYERLVASSVAEPVVFYNLANAYYRMGRLGHAVANYERALHLEPAMELARENLNKVLRETERNLPRPLPPAWEQALLFWHFRLPARSPMPIAILMWALCWALLAFHLWRPLPYLRAAAAACAVFASAFAASAWAKAHPQPLAVAAVDTAPARFGAGPDEKIRFELREGDRVVIEADEGAWLRVRTAGGERGWIQADHAVRVGPPYLPQRTADPAS